VSKLREFPEVAIVNQKTRPHPWDTYYQFSINTLLSKGGKKEEKINTHETPLSVKCLGGPDVGDFGTLFGG